MKYCKNCRYFVRAVYDDYSAYSHSAYCNAPTSTVIEDPVNGVYLKRVNLSIDNENYPNCECNCTFYKRKWWKFWIKEETK